MRSLVPDAAAAKDVLQETNVTLWSKANQFELGTNFWAWASQVAFYEVRAYRTRTTRDKCIFNDELVRQLAALAQTRSELEEQRQETLRICLKKLPQRDRDLVNRRYYGGLSLGELATEIDRSVGATRKLIQRARQALLNCITRTMAVEDRA